MFIIRNRMTFEEAIENWREMNMKSNKKEGADAPSSQPLSLMGIVDEAYGLIENRIDYLRDNRLHGTQPHMWEFSFLKDIRDLLKLSENFRDE